MNPESISLEERHERIRRAVTPLPGSTPCDRYKAVNVPADCDGLTLLDTLCRVVSHLPASHWEEESARGLILDEAFRPAGLDRVVRGGERYQHRFPNVIEPAVDGRVRILHEDEALVVIHKPAPLPMHAGGRFYQNTLQHILEAAYYPEKPRPAHRLDANTTGIVLVARARRFAARLQAEFAEGRVEKRYLVRVQGSPPEDAFHCDAPISASSGELGSRKVDMESGLAARTDFRVRRRDADGSTLLEARPLTGRTNQIRVHLWHLGMPVWGDAAYLPGKLMGRTQTLDITDAPLCLHAWRIEFQHPLTQQTARFEAPPPPWTLLDGAGFIPPTRSRVDC